MAGCFAAAAPTVLLGPSLSAAQSGAASFSRGELHLAGRARVQEVLAAVERTSDNLDLPIRRAKHEKLLHTYWLARANGGSITIGVIEESHRVTSIKVRVGFWGNQPLSRVIMGTIFEEIKALREEERVGPFLDDAPGPVVPFLPEGS